MGIYVSRWHLLELVRIAENKGMDPPTSTEMEKILGVKYDRLNKTLAYLRADGYVEVVKREYKRPKIKLWRRGYKVGKKAKQFLEKNSYYSFLDKRNPYLEKHRERAKYLNLIFKEAIDI